MSRLQTKPLLMVELCHIFSPMLEADLFQAARTGMKAAQFIIVATAETLGGEGAARLVPGNQFTVSCSFIPRKTSGKLNLEAAGRRTAPSGFAVQPGLVDDTLHGRVHDDESRPCRCQWRLCSEIRKSLPGSWRRLQQDAGSDPPIQATSIKRGNIVSTPG